MKELKDMNLEEKRKEIDYIWNKYFKDESINLKGVVLLLGILLFILYVVV